MTEIEKKALALVNEVRAARGAPQLLPREFDPVRYPKDAALCRAIEAHEAFKREVSDAVEASMLSDEAERRLRCFILPPPLDPLVGALNEAFPVSFSDAPMCPGDVDMFRAALAKRGGKIVFEGEG